MMNCPHCQKQLPAPRPVSNPKRAKIFGHHGEMDLDMAMLKAMAANAREHVKNRRETERMLDALRFYNEVVERMEFEPAFARHVLSYDGDGGERFFPGATRRAKIAELKARVARGQVRENDLSYYLDLIRTD